MLCACAEAGAPAAVADAGPDASARANLTPLFAALSALESGRRATPVSILQIGDSHTANDSFSGRMRELFQARFGDGGRGLMPPGIPYRYYRPAGAHVAATGWTTIGSFAPNGPGGPGPFGLAGLRQHADGPAEMTLSLDSGADTATVEVLAQPGGGTIELAADDDAPTVVSTASLRAEPRWIDVSRPRGVHMLTLRARGDGPVDVLSWRARLRGPGVTWSNLGTPGATAGLLGRWDPGLVDAELRHEAPDMIMLAFGTNEGFRNRPDLDDPADFGRALALLRHGAPASAYLVALPLDGVRKMAGGDCPGGYGTPPGLAIIRERERAQAGRAAVWDWSAAMGPRCVFVDWMRATPQLAAPDGVHLRQEGYARTAESLFAELMAGYDRYRATHAGPRR